MQHLLRYPGGKSKVADIIAKKIGNLDVEFREPFAGSGVVSIAVCLRHQSQNLSVPKIWLNDLDVGVASFWNAILQEPDKLIDRIRSFVPSVNGFVQAKDYLQALKDHDGRECFDAGFQKLVVHRLSFSGLGTKAGSPIGGFDQSGKYKVGCRWNGIKLANMVKTLNELFSNKVRNNRCTRLDYSKVIQEPGFSFIYLDPPYVKAGDLLYPHSFTANDHCDLSKIMKSLDVDNSKKWLLSYDNHDGIKKLYSGYRIEPLSVLTSQNGKKVDELLISNY